MVLYIPIKYNSFIVQILSEGRRYLQWCTMMHYDRVSLQINLHSQKFFEKDRVTWRNFQNFGTFWRCVFFCCHVKNFWKFCIFLFFFGCFGFCLILLKTNFAKILKCQFQTQKKNGGGGGTFSESMIFILCIKSWVVHF